MSSSIDEYVGVREVHKPLMPPTRCYMQHAITKDGRTVTARFWATGAREAEKELRRIIRDTWPGAKAEGAK